MVSTHRSGFYYRPQGESALNLEIMRLIDAYFMEHSHSGVITLCAYLCLSQGHRINVKRVPPADAVDGPDGGISQHEAQRP
jgi:putative transposase